MTDNSLVPAIMRVLEESATAQINLGSESARRVLAEQVVEAVTEEIRVWFEDDEDERDGHEYKTPTTKTQSEKN